MILASLRSKIDAALDSGYKSDGQPSPPNVYNQKKGEGILPEFAQLPAQTSVTRNVCKHKAYLEIPRRGKSAPQSNHFHPLASGNPQFKCFRKNLF